MFFCKWFASFNYFTQIIINKIQNKISKQRQKFVENLLFVIILQCLKVVDIFFWRKNIVQLNNLSIFMIQMNEQF